MDTKKLNETFKIDYQNIRRCLSNLSRPVKPNII
jgi:hypothetical protein